jgi:prepilin signal peptidase PulO-like enzyme (type II secretory pathway)
MGILLTIVFAYHTQFAPFRLEIFWRDIFFTTLLLIIFVYDALYYIILPRLVWLGVVVGLVFNYGVLEASLQSLLLGAAVGGGLFLAQFVVSKGRWIGGGDVRLGVLMGVWLGWPAIMVALLIAYVVGAVVALFLVAFKKKGWQAELPFGTFLTTGTFVSLFWGQAIVQWYLQIAGY